MSAGQGSAVVTGSIIASWYISNIGVIILNKYLLSIYGFKYPVFLTLCHMLACTLTSYAVAATQLVPLHPIKSRRQLLKVTALSLVFCLTVVLGNVSLRFIPVSFNQAVGSTTPAWVAALSLLMLRQRESRGTYLSLIPVVVGIIIASGAEPLFNAIGFFAAMSATGARAFKSVLQGAMLSDPSEKMDSMSLLSYMAPIAALSLVPLALYYEPEAMANAITLGQDGSFWGLLLINSFLAYFVNLTNFLVTKHTSALTLQVIGNAKGVVAVIVSILYFRNPVNFYSVLGYSITVCGVVAYSQAKKYARKQQLLRDMRHRATADLEGNGSGGLAQQQGKGSWGGQQLGHRNDSAGQQRTVGFLQELPPVQTSSNSLGDAEKPIAQVPSDRIFVDATGGRLSTAH